MTATPNAELAYKVLDHIDADPGSWNQRYWISRPVAAGCGTAACFAGWACMLSGDRPWWSLGAGSITDWVMTDGGEQSVEQRAAELLGIDENTGLFYSFNTREDLGRLVAEIFGPRPGTMP